MTLAFCQYPDSNRLAAQQKSFYPLHIPVSHWQLRHYVSHPDPDVLYYASGPDIYYLNTATRKRKHVAALPFEARCTASGHGYVCVGGEHDGHFAIIKLEESRPAAEVDSALPIHLLSAGRHVPQAAMVRVERIGEQIVNSISIHKIFDEEAHLYDVVAVLTNNDRTVRIYSLTYELETNVLRLPDAMNHASLSPDGKTLAAVGDISTCFFFRRHMKQAPPQIPKPHNRLNMTATRWEQVSDYKLHVPMLSLQRGYFTTAWSPRGHLLAVGSEAGSITVFDMEAFADDRSETAEAHRLVTVPSSRPNLQAHTFPGAVRSMLFSPDPWDLLIWAEDQGRICIGDLRTGLKIKQIVSLDPEDVSLVRYKIEDIEPDPDVEPAEASSETPSNRPVYEIAEPYRSYVAQPHSYTRWRSEQSTRDSLDNDPGGLTADETQILDSLRTTRQREEARNQGVPPRSIDYTSYELFEPWRTRRSGNRDDRPTNSTTGSAASRSGQMPYLSRRVEQYVMRENATRLRDRQVEMLPPLTRSSGSQITGLDRERSRSTFELDNDGSTSQTGQLDTLPPYARRAERMSRETRDSGNAGGDVNDDEDDSSWQVIMDAINTSREPRDGGSTTLRERRGESGENTQRESTSTSTRDRPPNASARSASTADFLYSADEHVRALAAQRDRLRTLQRTLNETSALYGHRDPTSPVPPPAPSAPDSGATGPPESRGTRYGDLYRSPARPSAAMSTRTGAAREPPTGNTGNTSNGGPQFEESWELLRRRTAATAFRDRLAASVTGGLGFLPGVGAEVGVRTAGLAVSADGRTVWAATEQGIFEIGIRNQERMRWPAVVMR